MFKGIFVLSLMQVIFSGGSTDKDLALLGQYVEADAYILASTKVLSFASAVFLAPRNVTFF